MERQPTTTVAALDRCSIGTLGQRSTKTDDLFVLRTVSTPDAKLTFRKGFEWSRRGCALLSCCAAGWFRRTHRRPVAEAVTSDHDINHRNIHHRSQHSSCCQYHHHEHGDDFQLEHNSSCKYYHQSLHDNYSLNHHHNNNFDSHYENSFNLNLNNDHQCHNLSGSSSNNDNSDSVINPSQSDSPSPIIAGTIVSAAARSSAATERSSHRPQAGRSDCLPCPAYCSMESACVLLLCDVITIFVGLLLCVLWSA